ncbi:MAG: hypothetical protein LUD02_12745 [Tannerellaceae bacterium]|nr:hypothetical protein [Tannerellaceae bacterium]MCD8264905.1 hypothetical protein [Tannerellaceae bacterium]
MVITMVFSLLLLVIGTFETGPLKDIYAVLNHIDFTKLLMGGYVILFIVCRSYPD